MQSIDLYLFEQSSKADPKSAVVVLPKHLPLNRLSKTNTRIISVDISLFIKNQVLKVMNYNSFFNQWRTQPSNGVNQLIDSPGITVGRLLDQEQFLNQYKSGNVKVAEFMKYQRYQELLQFVTVVGPPQDKKRSYKYPLTACQLLSIENPNANSIELFLPQKSILVETKTFENVQQQVEVQIDQSQVSKIQEKVQSNQGTQNNGQQQQKKTIEESLVNAEQQVEEASNKSEVTKIEKSQNKSQQNQKAKDANEHEVKQVKKIKIKNKITKKIQKIIQEEKPPLILKLLAYFKGQINYTLAGYISKILGFLLTKKPAQVKKPFIKFFKYVLEETRIEQIINHAQSRSVGELIIKTLTHQSTHTLELRQVFYKRLLARLSAPSEIYVISNLSTYVCEIIDKVAVTLKNNSKLAELSNIFFSLETITHVIKNVISQDESVSVFNAPVLLTYLTNVPFVLPEDQEIIQSFKKLGQLFIQKSCEKLQVQHSSRPKLGGGRIKLLQILRFVLKENLLNSKEIVASKKEFFPILLNLMKCYEMNNVLHNQIIKIFEIALVEAQDSPLNKSILSDNVLVNFIYSEADEDRKIRAGGSIYKSRKGYIAHVVNLALRLKQLSSTNDSMKAFFQNPQFSSIYDSFIEKENFNAKKSLAGFMIKKDIKHEIMFQKEDIITTYLKFFQKCPNAVFQSEIKQEETVNIEHPDLVQELQKQLQENLNVKPKEEENEVSQKEKEGKSQPEASKDQQVKNRQWNIPLQYNIDELVEDL